MSHDNYWGEEVDPFRPFPTDCTVLCCACLGEFHLDELVVDVCGERFVCRCPSCARRRAAEAQGLDWGLD
jgi:hypothetical protein